jgi:general secretion pathway protein G
MNKSDKSEQKTRRANAGFTLIEIMIVVVILGLLATLVTVNAPAMIHRHRVKIAKQNITMVQNAVDMYYSEMGKYPATLNDLVAAKDSSGTDLKIIKKVPKDPWGNDFVFVVPGQGGEDYSISCYGADGQQGGDSRNADINSWEMDNTKEQTQ